jgi:RNA polymerase sigma-70 factor (ECF subfamily)
MHDTELLQFIDGLYGYAMALSRNQHDAEDLVQETFVRAIRGKANLREGSNVKAWLFTILKNIYLNQIRKQKTFPRVIEIDADEGNADIVIEESKDPFAQYVSEVDREHVVEAVQQLPPEFREVILLREFEDLSYQEIAGVLGCPAGTVMSRLARARSRLRTLLMDKVQPVRPDTREHQAGGPA